VKPPEACVDIGLCLPQLGGHVNRDGLRRFCEQAEELGYASLWVQEHLFYPHEPVSGYSGRPGLAVPEAYRSMLAALETLTAAAAWTSAPIVGTSILVAGLHRPVALAQQLATIDVLSNGRVVAGFSVGWSDEEHQVMDVNPRTRGARMDELIDALLVCWGPDPVQFAGRFFQIPTSDIRPKPVQHPRPRLLSGMRSAAGLRRTAEKFDIWNPASGTLEQHLEIFGQLQAMRPAGMRPLQLYRRLFTTPPVQVANLRPLGVDELCADVAQARDAGVAAMIVDANFDAALDSPDRWAAVPRTLAPLLDAAA
jgi:probable F420-dependent oxidoreductase